MTLREVLHAHIPTLTAESTVRDAVDKMDIYQFPALVILDNDLKPTHVLTEGDLARAVSHRGNLVTLGDEPAAAFASQQPICAPADTEIGEALHLMLTRGLSILPVTDEGILSGVVLRVDLMQALLTDSAAVL